MPAPVTGPSRSASRMNVPPSFSRSSDSASVPRAPIRRRRDPGASYWYSTVMRLCPVTGLTGVNVIVDIS